jgi:hypothetical protein
MPSDAFVPVDETDIDIVFDRYFIHTSTWRTNERIEITEEKLKNTIFATSHT